MPVYEYEILGPDGVARGVYEVEQKMSEPALTRHPQTGEPLRRILSSTFAGASSSSASSDAGCASGACDFGGCGMGGGGCGGGACGWN